MDQKDSAAILSVKRSVVVNLKNTTMQARKHASNVSVVFETQDRHHQKSNTGIPTGPMSSKLTLKSIIYQGESDDSSERLSGMFRYQIPVRSTQRKRTVHMGNHVAA